MDLVAWEEKVAKPKIIATDKNLESRRPQDTLPFARSSQGALHSIVIATPLISHASTSEAEMTEIIDNDPQCLIWSIDQCGCTGQAAS